MCSDGCVSLCKCLWPLGLTIREEDGGAAGADAGQNAKTGGTSTTISPETGYRNSMSELAQVYEFTYLSGLVTTMMYMFVTRRQS